MSDAQQYTDAQLSDGRTLRFMGQLGPDEIRQKVSSFRTSEGARNIQASPPGVPRPSLRDAVGMHESTMLGDPNIPGEYVHAPMPGASDGANMAEGLSDWDKASFGELGGGAADIGRGNVARGAHRMISGAGAATLPAMPFVAAAAPVPLAKAVAGGYLGSKVGSTGAELLGATPDQADVAGDIGGIAGGYGANKVPLSRVMKMGGAFARGAAENAPLIGKPLRGGLKAAVRSWRGSAPPVIEGDTPQLTSGGSLIQQMGGKPVETITEKPSGRLVLSPDEVQAETRQMTLAKKLASQRGMQYAAGMKPEN